MVAQGSAEAAADASPPEGVLPASRRGWLLVLLVLLVALGGRTLVVLQSASWYEPKTDALHFDGTASSLAAGDGFGYAIIPPNTAEQEEPTAFRAPLYPLALAATYVVFGEHSWTMGRMLNAALGTIVVALIGLVASQIWNRRTGLAAMLVAALHPALILVGSSLQLEPLLGALMLATLAAALAHRRAPRGWTWPIVTGVLAGLTVLTRETGFFVVLPAAWLIFATGPEGGPARATPSRASLAKPVVMIAIAAAVVLPWTIRNAVELRAFVPVSTSSGIGLAGTYNETSMKDGRFPAGWRPPWTDPDMLAIMLELDDPTEAEVDARLRRASIDLIRDNPQYLVKAAVWNTQRLFDLDGGAHARHVASSVPYSQSLLGLGILGSYVLYVLALVSWLRERATVRQVPFAVWAIPLSTMPLLVVLLPGNIRYRYWLEPFLILVAAPLVAAGLESVQRRLGSSRRPALAQPS